MIYELTVPQFTKMLSNLNVFLEKAAQFADHKKFEMDVLLQSRLAPDQFNFIKQVQIACDTAKLGVSRLTGKQAPAHDDQEKTLPEIRARIESTIAFLKSVNEKDFSGCETKTITTPRWEGKTLTGKEFCIHHVIPNFYFHMTTAYAIFRHNGVDLGKKDFLGALPFAAPKN